jgi:hypothetical protein
MALITQLNDGDIVSQAGAFRVSMDHYHSQNICPGPSISSSGLRKIVMESEWHFWMSWTGNPNRYPDKEPGDGLVLGKAAHCLLLGDEVFDDLFIYVPKDAPRRPTATQIAAFERDGKWSDAAAPGASFWAEFDKKAAGRLLLTDEQVQKIGYMAENLRRNPLATEMLTGGMTEVSMVWQDPITGVWLKSRPDVIPDNGADFADLKTFAPQKHDIARAAQSAITDHAYHMQMALATMGAEAVLGTTATDCVLVMCQTTAPYTVTPVRLDEESLYLGRVMIRHGIDRFARCLETGVWPMPVEDVLTYTIPPSISGRLYEMQGDGRLPYLERNAG